MDDIFGWHGNFIKSCSIHNDSHLVIYIIWKNMPPRNVWNKPRLCKPLPLLWTGWNIMFHLLWRMGAFLCQHEASKINTACNITHTIEKPIAALSVSSENFLSVGFTWKSTIDCVLLRLYPILPKTALPTAQSSFTKSNDGTVTANHVPFAREKSLISLTSV